MSKWRTALQIVGGITVTNKLRQGIDIVIDANTPSPYERQQEQIIQQRQEQSNHQERILSEQHERNSDLGAGGSGI